MRAGGGKAKGASYERWVCRELSLWVSHNTRDDLFWRSSMSGGRATIGLATGKRRSAQAGDVSIVDADTDASALVSKYMIECKHLRAINLMDFITGTKSGILGIYLHALEQAAHYRKNPLVIVRPNFYPDLVFTNAIGALWIMGLLTQDDSAFSFLVPDRDIYCLPFKRLLGFWYEV